LFCCGIHDGEAVAKVRVDADGSLNHAESKVMPFYIECSKIWVGACTEEVALGVTL